MVCYFYILTYHTVCYKSTTKGATCGAGTAYPSGAPEFTSVFIGLFVARFLVFCVVFCLFFCCFSFGHCVFFPSSITASDYPIDIFQLF